MVTSSGRYFSFQEMEIWESTSPWKSTFIPSSQSLPKIVYSMAKLVLMYQGYSEITSSFLAFWLTVLRNTVRHQLVIKKDLFSQENTCQNVKP